MAAGPECALVAAVRVREGVAGALEDAVVAPGALVHASPDVVGVADAIQPAARAAAVRVPDAPAVIIHAVLVAPDVEIAAEQLVPDAPGAVTVLPALEHAKTGASDVVDVANHVPAGAPAALLTAQVYAKTRARQHAAQIVTAHVRRRHLAL